MCVGHARAQKLSLSTSIFKNWHRRKFSELNTGLNWAVSIAKGPSLPTSRKATTDHPGSVVHPRAKHVALRKPASTWCTSITLGVVEKKKRWTALAHFGIGREFDTAKKRKRRVQEREEKRCHDFM